MSCNRVQISIFEGRLAFFHIIRKVFRDDSGQNPVSGIHLGDDLAILRDHIVKTSDIGAHMIHGIGKMIDEKTAVMRVSPSQLDIIHDMGGKKYDPVS